VDIFRKSTAGANARRLPKDALHPKIREDVWALYHRAKYDTAVFEAMKAVEVAVRDAPTRIRKPSKTDPSERLASRE